VLSSRGVADAEVSVEAWVEQGCSARAARRCASREAKAKQGMRGFTLAWAGRGRFGRPKPPSLPMASRAGAAWAGGGREIVCRAGLCPTERAADAAAPRANVGGNSAKNHAPAVAVGRRRRAADAIVGQG